MSAQENRPGGPLKTGQPKAAGSSLGSRGGEHTTLRNQAVGPFGPKRHPRPSGSGSGRRDAAGVQRPPDRIRTAFLRMRSLSAPGPLRRWTPAASRRPCRWVAAGYYYIGGTKGGLLHVLVALGTQPRSAIGQRRPARRPLLLNSGSPERSSRPADAKGQKASVSRAFGLSLRSAWLHEPRPADPPSRQGRIGLLRFAASQAGDCCSDRAVPATPRRPRSVRLLKR